MTPDEQLAAEITAFDAAAERYLAALERKLRADVAAQGGPHDDDDDADLPPDPASPWVRVTIEEAILRERLSVQALAARWRRHLGLAG